MELGREEILEGLTQLFHDACEQEKRVKKNKRKGFLLWYEYAEEFNRKLEMQRKEEPMIATRMLIGRLYREIKEKCLIYSDDNIKKKSEKARKIYRILSKVGGKEKIRKLKKCNSENFVKLTVEEIKEWENQMEEKDVSLMSGSTTPIFERDHKY